MKKFVHDVKAAVGTAPKTMDAEYDTKSKEMKDVEKAIQEYTSSVDKMKAAANTMSQALDSVAKAFAALTADAETPESMKKVSSACEEAAKKIRDEDLATYVKALESEAASPMKDVKAKIAEVKKVEAARRKIMAEYDTYREAVDKKEKEYAKKGKDITESKNYQEDVKKRDATKTKFDEENAKYKEQVDAINKERVETFLGAMKGFSADTAKYFSAVEKNIASVHATADKAKV